MTLIKRVGRFIRLARDRGLTLAVRSYWDRLDELVQERRFGIRSTDIIFLKDLGLEHEDRRECAPISFRDFRTMRKFLRPVTANDVFIDYGCGLGRAVILAATLPFAKVIGVEISTVIAERARANVTRCRKKLKCKQIEIIDIDATVFDIPRETTTVFFNNPFAGAVLSSVIGKIKASYLHYPRAVRLVCNLPLKSAFSRQIREFDGLELQHEFFLSGERQCLVFLVTADNIRT